MAKRKESCFNSIIATETIKVCNVNDFPFTEEVLQFINAIIGGIEKSSLYYLIDCFHGFSIGIQKAIVKHLKIINNE